MINAAEPVDQAAIANFYETFRPFGLSSGVVVPTYGLAEHTVFVCSGGSTILSLKKSSFDSKVVEIVGSAVLGDSGGGGDSSNIDSDDSIQTIVGCGYPIRGEGVRVVIVDSETHSMLGEDKVSSVCQPSDSFYTAIQHNCCILHQSTTVNTDSVTSRNMNVMHLVLLYCRSERSGSPLGPRPVGTGICLS